MNLSTIPNRLGKIFHGKIRPPNAWVIFMIALIGALLYILWRPPHTYTIEGNTGMPWLCDFHVKTAFNACAESHERNATISTTQLKKVIMEGYRCLDFEIHPLPVSNAPVIASSLEDSMTEWASGNTIPFSMAMKELKVSGFITNAPLFINLRIKSTDPAVMDNISDALGTHLSNRLLRSVSNVNAMTDSAIGKVIVMVDAMSDEVMVAFQKSKLKERTNIVFGSGTMTALKSSGLIAISNPKEYEKNTRNQFTIVYPEAGNKNPNPALPVSYGCQFIAMQVNAKPATDAHLDTYNTFFKNSQYAPSRVLKTEAKRHDPGYEIVVPSGPKVEAKQKIVSDGINAIANVGKD